MSTSASSDAVLAQFVERAGQLYSLPAVAMRVLELTRTPTVDVQELQNCVAGDPALAGKLLRVVNSSLFGLSKPVGNLNQAITLLGIQRLKMLVLGFSLPTHSTSSIQPTVLDRYWRHALLKSVAAREISESLWKMCGDEPFVMGLLEDLGLLVLVQDLGDSYIKFLHGVWTAGNDPRAMEIEVLGFDHVQLTAKLLESWGFPGSMVRAVAAPRGPHNVTQLSPTERSLPQILDLAELLTRFLLDRQVRWLDQLLDTGDVYLGLRIEQLYSVLARVEEMTPQLAEVMSIPWSDETNYVALLEEAHQRQAETITRVASELVGPPTKRPIEVLAAVHRTDVSETTKTVSEIRPATSTPNTAGEPSNGKLPGVISTTASVITTATAGFVGKLTTVVASCRQSRLPISLLLLELDDLESIRQKMGAVQIGKFLQDIKLMARQLTDGNINVFLESVSDLRLGVIMAGADRRETLVLARQIIDGIRKWSDRMPPGFRSLSVSIGVAALAMPPRNFPVEDFVQAAERCLNGVKLSGGNGVKSIDIC